MSNYELLRAIHLTAIHATILSFLIRAIWRWTKPDLLYRRWVRVVPALIDTVLLFSGLGLILILQQYPFVNSWLTAKLIAVLAYIGFASYALYRGKSRQVQAVALGVAVLLLVYVYLVARSHSPVL